MEESKGRALVPFSASGNGIVETGQRSIVVSMVRDALALAQSQGKTLAAARFRIGDYEFCDPDYRQILDWANELNTSPDQLLDILRDAREKDLSFGHAVAFTVKNGHIDTLIWDFDRLPIQVFEWLDGLMITYVYFKGSGNAPADLNLRLPFLEYLYCPSLGLGKIDLSGVRRLAFLDCSDNHIDALDLSKVPLLTSLTCGMNELVELDVSNLRELNSIDCPENAIAKINLFNTPALEELGCSNNCLTAIDLNNHANLRMVWCDKNQLLTLGLSKLPLLDDLDFSGNLLTEVDLTEVPQLTLLDCSENELRQIDLFSVPKLGALFCANNRIESLDMKTAPLLVNLDCSGNLLTELDLSPVLGLEKLLCHDNRLTKLNILRNQKLSAIGCRNNNLSEPDLKIVRETTAAWDFKGDLCRPDVHFLAGRTDFLTDVAKL